VTIPQALQIAGDHHRAGRLAEAETLCRQILAIQPNHADALHSLGLIAHQAGRDPLAVEWIRKAIFLAPNNPVAHFNLGVVCRALGRLDEAITAFRRALQLQPDFLEAHNNLGIALKDRGWIDEAIAAYRRALELNPDLSEIQNNLSDALRERGLLDAAIAACRRALELKSDFPEAHNNLGNALKERGRLDEAVAAYHRALELKPGDPKFHVNLGNALRDGGFLDEAAAAFRRALQINPDDPQAHNDLGNTLRDRGQLEEAVAAYHRALELKPDDPKIHNNLGNALRDRDQLDQAVAAYRRALQLKPHDPKIHKNLGNALTEQGQFAAACASYRRALELEPGDPETHNDLGAALKGLGLLDEAIAACRRALELKPDYPEATNNLGAALAGEGQVDEAIAAYRQALEHHPEHAWLHSNLIFTLNFHPGYDARAIAAECARWERQHAGPLRGSVRPHGNNPDSDRRLKVGYVSPNFFGQAECCFVIPLLEAHDHCWFEVHAYSDVQRPDAITERMKKSVDFWRDTRALSDEKLAEQIREDGIDVLVDLSMHMGRNRLSVFAREPAPVQVAWLAYPGSTGLDRIGYRLTDARLEPPGEASAWSAEEPVRLPDCWCCYHPVGETPEVNELPALSSKGVTFGSLNSFMKVHEGVLARWARVLEAVRGSRLVLLCPGEKARERVRSFFGARGIAAETVDLVDRLPRAEYLSLYHGIDIGLDPFPYNGITTTCDAFWMGAPVLTLPGEMPASRAGLSLLSAVGLAEFAASSEEDYVRVAVELAANLPRLAELRTTLRPRMQASPLMDAPSFAGNVEAAYRSMWERWCAASGRRGGGFSRRK